METTTYTHVNELKLSGKVCELSYRETPSGGFIARGFLAQPGAYRAQDRWAFKLLGDPARAFVREVTDGTTIEGSGYLEARPYNDSWAKDVVFTSYKAVDPSLLPEDPETDDFHEEDDIPF